MSTKGIKMMCHMVGSIIILVENICLQIINLICCFFFSKETQDSVSESLHFPCRSLVPWQPYILNLLQLKVLLLWQLLKEIESLTFYTYQQKINKDFQTSRWNCMKLPHLHSEFLASILTADH